MIRHLYSAYDPADPETIRRGALARQTWPRQPWRDFPVRCEHLPRRWLERGRAFPHLRDLFDAGVRDAADETIVCYTNFDIHVRGDCCAQVAAALAVADACYAYRRDFHHRLEAPLNDADFAAGHWYPGSDLAAFRAGWWRSVRDRFPDFIIGFEGADPCLRLLIERTNPGAEVCVRDVIAHERHSDAGHWEHPDNRYTSPGQRHNIRLARVFLIRHGVKPAAHGLPN